MRGWLAVLVLSGCVPTGVDEDVRQGGSRHAIIGGEPTGPTDPEVFALYDQTGQFFCSATLIHPRVLLTAAHCVEHGVAHIGNAPDGPADRTLRVWRTWSDPRYAATADPAFDVGLVLFSSSSTLTPRLFEHALTIDVGAPVRAVGFGAQSPFVEGEPDPLYGERRTVELEVTALDSSIVHIGEPGRGICYGDSGGPLFATNDAGIERIIGIHSYGHDPTCNSGAGAVRVDVHAANIDAWLATYATPTCQSDGECLADCEQLDPDCVCGADGECTAACVHPSLDPDCPPLCDADDLCGLEACPIPDLDCRPVLTRCDNDWQCADHVCTTDPQNPTPYCSKRCQIDAECEPHGLQCASGVCRIRQLPEARLGEACSATVPCVQGTRCHAATPEKSVCATVCYDQSQCTPNFLCRLGASDFKACVAPPRKVKLVPGALGNADARCSVGGQSAAVMLVALLLQRRRRRASRSTASEKIAPPPVEQPPRTIIGSATES